MLKPANALAFRVFTRFNSTSKPFYITTPIFYVNAKPHLGHLYSMLLCDTRSRWEKLNPRQSSFLLTGTDEHGLKIQEVAAKQGIDCKVLVDRVSENFKNLAQILNIDYNRFMRTTDADHLETVKFFWKLMEEKGLIYEGSHSGWYSVSDETFYPETQIEEVIDKATGKTKKISKETKNEVIYQDEINYFFKLSHFQQDLIDFLLQNPDFVRPASKYTELLNELTESKLPDLSISRPSSRLKWAVEVPNDESQKIYVWFDALLNYVTAIGFPGDFKHENNQFIAPASNPWPATHVVGKDIIRFHCIYWPIFLMAAGMPLPKQVIVHSHWLSEGFKMSKSLGNVVDPIETYEYYGEDALRFFLTENSNINSDCNYSEKAFHDTRETLIGKYANLITRAGGAAFNIEESVSFQAEGRFINIDKVLETSILNPKDKQEIFKLRDELITSLNALYATMNEHMTQFDHMKAIQDWWTPIEKANQLFQLGQPWIYTKALKNEELSEDALRDLKTIQLYYIFLAAETSRITSILIQPVIPSLSSTILDRLHVSPEKRTSDQSIVGADTEYGAGANSKTHKIPIQRVPIRT